MNRLSHGSQIPPPLRVVEVQFSIEMSGNGYNSLAVGQDRAVEAEEYLGVQLLFIGFDGIVHGEKTVFKGDHDHYFVFCTEIGYLVVFYGKKMVPLPNQYLGFIRLTQFQTLDQLLHFLDKRVIGPYNFLYFLRLRSSFPCR